MLLAGLWRCLASSLRYLHKAAVAEQRGLTPDAIPEQYREPSGVLARATLTGWTCKALALGLGLAIARHPRTRALYPALVAPLVGLTAAYAAMLAERPPWFVGDKHLRDCVTGFHVYSCFIVERLFCAVAVAGFNRTHTGHRQQVQGHLVEFTDDAGSLGYSPSV